MALGVLKVHLLLYKNVSLCFLHNKKDPKETNPSAIQHLHLSGLPIEESLQVQAISTEHMVL